MNHTDSRKQEYQTEPLSFSKGTWLIERKENELFVSINESGASFREIKRMPCTTAPLRELQVLCTRQESGNSPTEFLLKRVQFVGDQFFSQPPPKPPFWNAWKISVLGLLVVATGGGAFFLNRIRGK
jgi:hypothetical protein